MRPVLIPPMVAEIVYNACTGVEGAVFDMVPSCPCGGKVHIHDTIKRRFSRVISGGTIKDIHVLVKRFICGECGLLIASPAPFYEKTRYGAPVIDLCLTIARNHPYYQTARILEQMGIIIDRGTVRNLVLHHNHAVEAGFFIRLLIPVSVISLSSLITSCDPDDPNSLHGADIMEVIGMNWSD